MNIGIYPLLADIDAFGEQLNSRMFAAACGFALVAVIVAFLPRTWRGTRAVSIGSALVCICLVVQLVRLNSPQWQPAPVLLTPVAFSLFAAWWSWRELRGGPRR